MADMYSNSSSAISHEDKKLFIGGLGWDTTEKQIHEYFSKYGEVESISLKTNPATGRSRGFAFVVFTNAESVDSILETPDHMINGRKVDAKKAIARTGKIFVGGLKPEVSDDDIRIFFNQFGKVVDLEVPFDKTRNARKGFCFVTFEQENVVNELLRSPSKTINGCHVDLRRAMPKDAPGAIRGGRGGFAESGYGDYSGGGGGYDYGSYGGYGGGSYDYNGYSGYGDYSDYGGYENYGSYRGGRPAPRHHPY